MKRVKNTKLAKAPTENYFGKIIKRTEELDKLGQAYLDSVPFIPNDEIYTRIFAAAKQIFAEANEDWNTVPEWVASTMDYWMPYSQPQQRGSLLDMLRYSIVSNDAHFRHLLEIAEGRATEQLPFPVCAEYEKTSIVSLN